MWSVDPFGMVLGVNRLNFEIKLKGGDSVQEEFILIKTEIDMKAIGKKVVEIIMEYILIIMEIVMMEIGKTIKKMEKEFIIIVMEIEEWEIIMKISRLENI